MNNTVARSHSRRPQSPETEHALRQRYGKYFLVTLVVALISWQVYVYWSRPPVVHRDNLKFVQLIRTACSSQREDYLAGIERSLLASQESLSEAELSYFRRILALARAKDWEAADELAKKLEDAQLSRRR